MKGRVLLLSLVTWLCFFSGKADRSSFAVFKTRFISGYAQLQIPDLGLDYREYFNAIPSVESIARQKVFFRQQQQLIEAFEQDSLALPDAADLAQIRYEIDLNLYRLELEDRWIASGRKMPEEGLYSLADHQQWYAYFIRRFTSTDITPEQVFALGQSEVKRVKQEIDRLQHQLGYSDSFSFYGHLQDSAFYIYDKQAVVDSFKVIDQQVRRHLNSFVTLPELPEVYAMEWTEANAHTPPGMYLNHAYNAYGKDVFLFNFYRKRYNRRAMEWLYMHEAIPGHHLQASFRSALPQDSLQDLFSYPGNFEGWACYVEYAGKELGLYRDAYSELGKWEWDLVRSARLVMDAGIHYYGWTRERAMQYWKETIPAQNDIAAREVTRVTNWAAQALSYKVGAHYISRMKESWQRQYPAGTARDFHDTYLRFGMRPLIVIEKLITT